LSKVCPKLKRFSVCTALHITASGARVNCVTSQRHTHNVIDNFQT